MHEQSLTRNLLRQVDEIRRQHDSHQVQEVRVEVGLLSGVEPLLLASAFEQLATGDTVAKAELVIDQVGLTVRCDACGHEYDISDFDFRCSTCAGNVTVVRGDRIELVSVSLQFNDPNEECVA